MVLQLQNSRVNTNSLDFGGGGNPTLEKLLGRPGSDLGDFTIGGIDGSKQPITIDLDQPARSAAAKTSEGKQEFDPSAAPGSLGFTQRNGEIFDNATGQSVVSRSILNQFDKLGAGTLPRTNPLLDLEQPFGFDPRGFDLENFVVGPEIMGQIGNIQGGAASQSINDILTGNAPSLAQLQLEDATEKNLSNISSLVNTQRGNPLAFRQGLRSGEEAQRGLGRDASILRSQETLNAINASQGQDKIVSDLVQLGLQERLAKKGGAVDLQKSQAEELRQRRAAELGVPSNGISGKDFIGPGILAGGAILSSAVS